MGVVVMCRLQGSRDNGLQKLLAHGVSTFHVWVQLMRLRSQEGIILFLYEVRPTSINVPKRFTMNSLHYPLLFFPHLCIRHCVLFILVSYLYVFLIILLGIFRSLPTCLDTILNILIYMTCCFRLIIMVPLIMF